MAKVVRNMDTKEAKSFWETAEKIALEVRKWPDARRAGINVSDTRASSVIIRSDARKKNKS